MGNSTLEDMLQYIYKEKNDTESAAILHNIQSNWALQEKFNVLFETISRLQKTKLYSPRNQTMQRILDYAAKKVEA
ncbi:MAG: hypothetical protein JSS67_00450 [Bacteroidetes bacterium]|nr:hypothetical protein [Bacteroidota bacterium]